MLLGPMFFFHFLNPILAAINFIFFLPKAKKLTQKSHFLPILPLALYGVFYFVAVFLNLFPDFYQLTFGGNYLITILSILTLATLTFLISLALSSCRNRRFKLK
ncbi:MAG: hypothetical protein Q4B65_02520 [Candidatus Saccharibacteria bacterium]|nr:hypothetical protein [Candidatus Saccharibacteria bacterium]